MGGGGIDMRLALVTLALLSITAFRAPAWHVDEPAAVRQAVLDYAEGYYERDAGRMERAISPLLTKRALVVRPGAASFLQQMNAEMLVEAARATVPRPAAGERRLVAEVFDVSGDIASARVFSVQFNDYIHLTRRDGGWRLVNVLWHSPLPAPAATAEIAPAIEQASRDFAGLAGAPPGRVNEVVSPVAAIRTLMHAPSGAKVLRDQNTESLAAAIATGRLPKRPQVADLTVLGADGNIASVKVGSGPATTYLHLALQNGRWIVVNTLSAVASGG
jgi:hypothetical protein